MIRRDVFLSPVHFVQFLTLNDVTGLTKTNCGPLSRTPVNRAPLDKAGNATAMYTHFRIDVLFTNRDL